MLGRGRRRAGGAGAGAGEDALAAANPEQQRERRRQRPGVVAAGLDEGELVERLAALGERGLVARALDEAVQTALPGLVALSPLSSPLAVGYLERVRHALKQLSLETAVFVTTRAYVAHLLVEADPAAFGAADVPVLGTLPPLRKGRPPQDLLNRVVKASRRGFEQIRALDDEVWAGFVDCTTWRVHQRAAGPSDGEEASGEAPGYLDPAVVDGLLRFGWVLRQVDIHYRVEPERA